MRAAEGRADSDFLGAEVSERSTLNVELGYCAPDVATPGVVALVEVLGDLTEGSGVGVLGDRPRHRDLAVDAVLLPPGVAGADSDVSVRLSYPMCAERVGVRQCGLCSTRVRSM